MTDTVTQDAPVEAEAPPAVKGLLAKRVEQFIMIRDKRKAMKKAYVDADKPFLEGENKLSAAILKLLLDAGIKNAAVPNLGTVFLTTKTTASLSDPKAFMDYVITNAAFDLMDRKANKTAVQDFVKKHKELPPGVNLNSMQTIGLHKKVGGGSDTDADAE